jgi:phenylalanyl-tRNA synthetase beta chain
MKISINWLKDFVDLNNVSNQELIKRLTLSTAEIEEVYDYGKNIKNVVVAKIIKSQKAENSNKLSLLKVDAGDKVYDVVCGAPNCKEGMLVAFAKLGAEIDGLKISEVELAGHKSQGMCCSEKELGISENHEGIMHITKDVKLGTNIKDIFGIEDTVFEVDNKSLTNRPDLWCHYGFAREVAAIFNKELKPIDSVDLTEYNNLENLDINIQDTKKCYRYSGVKINNITKNESPKNMQIRLFYTGMRSLNLLADLTNYVMLEVGQPMHAFDSSKAPSINVKTADEQINFKTLDGEERKIDKDTLMIYSKNTPLAVAGIMGGLDSEVQQNTTSILLESANFEATTTRRSANKLNLRTEASLRYEKSLDPSLTTLAIARFIKLLVEVDNNAQVTSSVTDKYVYKYPQINIDITSSFIEDYCGVKLGQQKIVDILNRLDFKVKVTDNNLTVTVPSHRATKDVTISADLVEEISRIYGYDNITPKAVTGKVEPVEQQAEHILEYHAKRTLAQKFNLSEVHTYLWNDVKANSQLNITTKGYVKVLNSTVKNNDEIRSELSPSLLKVINENKLNTQDDGIFEVGRVVTGLDENNKAIEQKNLSIVLTSKTKTDEQIYFDLKRILEFLFTTYKKQIPMLQLNKVDDASYLHPRNNAVITHLSKKIGKMGLLHPAVNNQIDKKLKVAVLELNFNKFSDIKQKNTQTSELSKYQTTVLDFNFLANKNLTYFDLKTLFNAFESKLDYTFNLKDVFENDEQLNNKKSYTLSFEIGAKDHTLSSDEIEKFHNNLIEYAKQNGLELR